MPQKRNIANPFKWALYLPTVTESYPRNCKFQFLHWKLQAIRFDQKIFNSKVRLNICTSIKNAMIICREKGHLMTLYGRSKQVLWLCAVLFFTQHERNEQLSTKWWYDGQKRGTPVHFPTMHSGNTAQVLWTITAYSSAPLYIFVHYVEWTTKQKYEYSNSFLHCAAFFSWMECLELDVRIKQLHACLPPTKKHNKIKSCRTGFRVKQ